MTCPECGFPVRRGAILTASGLFGTLCDHCGAELQGTLESRVRLSAISLLVGLTVGSLAQSLGVSLWLAIAIGMTVLTAWYVLRAEATVILEEATHGITRPQE